MQIRCKIKNIIGAYILLLLMNFLVKGTFTWQNGIQTICTVILVTYLFNWLKYDRQSPFAYVAKYVVLAIIAFGVALSAFLFHFIDLTIIQYLGFMLTSITAYYLMDTAFDERID